MGRQLEAHRAAATAMKIVGASDVTSMVEGIFPLIIEALEGGCHVRRTYLDMVVPTSATEASASTMVHEGYRVWMYILPELTGRLPENFRGGASAWLTEFATDWMREVERKAVAERERLGLPR